MSGSPHRLFEISRTAVGQITTSSTVPLAVCRAADGAGGHLSAPPWDTSCRGPDQPRHPTSCPADHPDRRSDVPPHLAPSDRSPAKPTSRGDPHLPECRPPSSSPVGHPIRARGRGPSAAQALRASRSPPAPWRSAGADLPVPGAWRTPSGRSSAAWRTPDDVHVLTPCAEVVGRRGDQRGRVLLSPVVGATGRLFVSEIAREVRPRRKVLLRLNVEAV